jgi:hypothetical protein
MEPRLLHIFRNTPLGRETFLQSIYFCKTLNVGLTVHIPASKKFLMYFEYDAVEVELDNSYLAAPDSALPHVQQLLERQDMPCTMLESKEYTASNLPDVSTDFQFMCLPRVIAEQSNKIALGKIGSKVRGILKAAHFPVLIPSPVFKPWKSIMVMYGGSVNAEKSMELGLRLSRNSRLPLDVFTHAAGKDKAHYRDIMEKRNLPGCPGSAMAQVRDWHVFEDGEFTNNLYVVPHDALVVMGAYGHGLIKDMVFGSKMELVQSTLPNNLLIAGPRFDVQPWCNPALET